MGKLWNKKSVVHGVVLSGFLVFLSGCSLLPKEEAGLAPPLVEPVRENIQLYKVVKGDITDRVLGTAVVEPVEIAYHQFSLSGVVKEIHVKPGQMIKKGDLLVERNVDGLELTLMQRKLDVAKKERELSQAREQGDTELIKIRKMELDIANYQLNETLNVVDSSRLEATADGQLVFLTDLEPGDRFNPSDVLASVADTSQMVLSYQPSSAQVTRIEFGMKVKVSFQGVEQEGTVIQTPLTAPKVANPNLSSRYERRIYIELDEFPPKAVFGDYADIEITLAERLGVLTIPRGGLRSFGGRSYVQIMDGESRKEVDVTVGLESSREVEIVEGLEEGQLVILQ
jgi:multidrug efflux pump subunit AcrA (membrane-fusion protein)